MASSAVVTNSTQEKPADDGGFFVREAGAASLRLSILVQMAGADIRLAETAATKG